jgi:NADPH:quinone reductase-like Zn-dependent oxidoreductase/NAD(P)-dependent dehydrogenase (short-subunit alcohol dehydrogenase family)/acyl carrier protein
VPEVEINSGALSTHCLIAATAQDHVVARQNETVPKHHVLIVTEIAEHHASLHPSIAHSLRTLAEKSDAVVTLIPPIASSYAEAMEAWFGSRPESANVTERRDIFYLPGIETFWNGAENSGEDALDWQEKVLGGALRCTQELLLSGRLAECRLWLVSSGAIGPKISAPEGATLAAFGRSVRGEYTDAQIISVDVDAFNINAEKLWQICETHTNETEYALIDDATWVPRLIPLTLSGNHSQVQLEQEETRRLYLPGTGLLEDLKPVREMRQVPESDEVEIAIEATAINFHEVLSALDAEHFDQAAPGGECAGVVVRVGSHVNGLRAGDEVVAIGSGLMADFATLIQAKVWKKPSRLRIEDAATLLIPFLTARWSLDREAKLQQGESILVHSGAGGVGLAAIQEARRLGAVVFATAGTEAKRKYLRDLGIEYVFDSRSTAFEHSVLMATGFRGVDVVLNSLGGDKLIAGLRTLAPRGRFIELGEKTVLTNAQVKNIRPDVSYIRIHLKAALVAASPEVREMIAAVLADVETGRVNPLPWKKFSLNDAPEAFRHMATAHQTGRVLLTGGSTVARSRSEGFCGFRRDGAYVVTGAFTGLGLLTVEWLAQQGAGYVLALGRRGPGLEANGLFARLDEVHVEERTQVVALTCDVSDRDALAQALRTIPNTFELRGVFHSAGSLDDAILPNQNWSRFRSVLSAKVAGAWNLHRETLSADLDCFVLFSSAAAVLGSKGQSNHAAANAYLDALAHYRRDQLGLTALSVNWGAWSGTGAAVRHGVVERSERSGVLAISPQQGLRLLGLLLKENRAQVMASHVSWRKWSESYRAEADANATLLSKVLLRQSTEKIARFEYDAETDTERKEKQFWRDKLLRTPESQRLETLEAHVESRVRAILSFPETQPIDSSRPLQEYGLDSLLSIELRNALSADLDIKLSATALFDYPTLRTLTEWLSRDVLKLGAQNECTMERTSKQTPDVIEEVALLSDNEVEKLLLQKMAGM